MSEHREGKRKREKENTTIVLNFSRSAIERFLQKDTLINFVKRTVKESLIDGVKLTWVVEYFPEEDGGPTYTHIYAQNGEESVLCNVSHRLCDAASICSGFWGDVGDIPTFAMLQVPNHLVRPGAWVVHKRAEDG